MLRSRWSRNGLSGCIVGFHIKSRTRDVQRKTRCYLDQEIIVSRKNVQDLSYQPYLARMKIDPEQLTIFFNQILIPIVASTGFF